MEESVVASRVVVNKRNGRKSRVRFVGVKFINIDQTVCWTNYSSDGKGSGKGSWLTKDDDLTQAEYLRRGREGMVDLTPPPAPLPTAVSQQIPILDGAANTATSDETHELDGLD